MKIFKENTTRKLDGLGRISIPKAIRDRFNLENGTEMEFFVGVSDTESYIMFKKFNPTEEVITDEDRITCAKVLEQLGLDVPDEVLNVL